MKLSEIKGEKALDVLADIIDPIAKISQDKKMRELLSGGQPRMLAVKHALKNHKKEVIAIMAALDLKDPKNYEFTLIDLPVKLLELLNDPQVNSLFTQQSQMSTSEFSGSAMENTGAEKE